MNLFKLSGSLFVVIAMLLFTSCGGDPKEDPKPVDPDPITINIDPTAVKQEMIGFGGALTWYSNWVTGSANKNAIADLMFTDLGIDIIRFKNWYYPDNYPTVKTTDVMTDDYSKPQWDATNELYTMAKARVPGVKVLLSSWGPPAALKGNNSSRQGTLKKDGGLFMYDAFADYWVDVLDHVPFNPDYISIQNEPTFVTSGWTTCEWANVESTSLPDYHIAFNKVYDKIKNRTNPPAMMGPESQDVPTFVSFAQKLKDNPNCAVMAYHPYNINTSSPSTTVVSSLQSVGAFNTKPNIMTEFSDNLNWFNTALFIHRSMVHANSSGFIYWKLSWSTPTTGEDAGMVSVTFNGTHTVTKYFHLIKHFSKNIDAGYDRIETTSPNGSLLTSAFMSPDGKKITLIIINSGSASDAPLVTVAGKTIASLSAVQSKEGSYYKTLTVDSADDTIQVPAQSITTVVININ
jgi:glucuronoarabinoxylan endo-1,4-beta-xylanase